MQKQPNCCRKWVKVTKKHYDKIKEQRQIYLYFNERKKWRIINKKNSTMMSAIFRRIITDKMQVNLTEKMKTKILKKIIMCIHCYAKIFLNKTIVSE